MNVDNAHKVLASGKDLEAVETDLGIAQVRAGIEGIIFASVLWGLTYLGFRER